MILSHRGPRHAWLAAKKRNCKMARSELVKGIGAAMAAAVVCARSVMALDLPGAGETYTVPFGVTNEVTEADMGAFNALGKVVFTDETSALRFTSATAPNVLLEGAGWMIKDNDAEWSLSCQQSTAWVGTWDFKAGTVKLVSPDGTANKHGALFNYSCPDLHDVYIRDGADLYGFVDSKCCQAYNKVRFHLAGQIETRAGGFGPNVRQVFLDDDATWYNGTSTTPTFGFTGEYDGLLNLNGYTLTANGGNYDVNSFYMQGATINGPGTFYVHPYVCGGLIVRSYNSENYDGWLCLDGGAVVTGNVRVAATVYDTNPGSDTTKNSARQVKYGIVRHKDASFTTGNRVAWFGKYGGIPAYLLEKGLLNCPAGMVMRNADPDNVEASATYMHFRQTGGEFKTTGLAVTNFTAGFGRRADIAFGGTDSSAEISAMCVNGDAAFSFNDGVNFRISNLGGYIRSGGGHHIWAYNGGVAENRFLEAEMPDGDFFAFNGGVRAIYNEDSTKDVMQTFGTNATVCVYSKGGEIRLLNSGFDLNSTKGVAEIREPRGNVVKSIACPPANKVFRSVPLVEIVDNGGTGTGAVAVVDYDFKTRTVTNITVLCGGENYSSSENVKASIYELNFYNDGRASVSGLACEVGPEGPADFTFAATNSGAIVRMFTYTNHIHGALVVDMDQLGVADGGASLGDWDNSLHIYYEGAPTASNNKPCFPNCNNIIMKSGQMSLSSSWGYNHDYLFPNCYQIEFYGGHIAGGTFLATNVVVGGTAYLTGHNLNKSENSDSPYWVDLQICDGQSSSQAHWKGKDVPLTPGTMSVDVDSTPDDEPSRLKGGGKYMKGSVQMYHGMLRFGGTADNPSVIRIRNYESIKADPGKNRLLLDLSDENLEVIGANNVRVETPADIADKGSLVWKPLAKKLYWKPPEGLYLMFR